MGDKQATLPTVTGQQKLPTDLVTRPMLWKQYKQLKKIFGLETHCQDKGMDIVVNRHLAIISQLNTEFDALPLDLTLQETFEHILKNTTDVVTTQEEYMKTHAELLGSYIRPVTKTDYQLFLIKVTITLRQLVVLNNGKAYVNEFVVAQCQLTKDPQIRHLETRIRQV